MNEPLSLIEYERRAREILQRTTYEYFAAGAGTEITLRENREAYDALRLRPRVLVPVSERNHAITLLGQSIESPILVAPMAFQKLAHRRWRTRYGPSLCGRRGHLRSEHGCHLLARRNRRRERRAEMVSTLRVQGSRCDAITRRTGRSRRLPGDRNDRRRASHGPPRSGHSQSLRAARRLCGQEPRIGRPRLHGFGWDR